MRPLGLGEILDRAVTVFVRNAWLFIAIAAILYVPLSVSQLAVGDFWGWYVSAVTQSASGSVPAPVPHQLMDRLGGFETIQVALLLLLSPFVYVAGLYAADRRLSGEHVTFAQTVRFALRQWPRAFGLTLLFALAIAGVFFAFMLGLTLIALVAAAMLHVAALGVILGLAAFGCMLVVMIAALVAFSLAMAALVAEGEGPIAAFRLGLDRVVNREFFWRSVLLGLILAAITLGLSLVGGVVAFSLMSVLKSPLPMVLINGLVGLLQFGLYSAVLMTYAQDLRARREGVDLALLAAGLDTPAPQVP